MTFGVIFVKDLYKSVVNKYMGLVRLRIREYAKERGWTIKEVSERSGVVYSTLRTYARSPGLATVDVTALQKLARTFDVMMEDLIEVVEE
ncbi:Helix-turn-helix domain protein [uncultured Coleofasciculus sp.]|uniref:Helix-turn-helix domain protein n=1 Tax=uncultured Coleofasciculus sp. TaxID=1267456 RepID=A0A6J4JW76_9CYAN|nr:Helix-turn-helix domain protein [uncultured Coleofasciculus sp.]